MPTKVEGRPVESATRVTVAFPFSTIKIVGSDDAEPLGELAVLLAAVTAELHAQQGNEVTADLAARTGALATRLAPG